jgi:23S rRNA-/tRNA-specific pseudouridylate synthase
MDDVRPAILFREDGLVAVDKPAGLASTGRDLDDPDCLQSWLIERTGRMVWAVHQLDADTSGVILFVERKRLVAELAQRLRHPGSRKVYLAICHGVPAFERKMVDARVGALAGDSPRRLGVTPSGRAARSRVVVVDRTQDAALVQVAIATGRTHQIRIHLASLGHPLVGERIYRDPPSELHPRHALHASSLTLGGSPRQLFHAPFPADLERLARSLGLDPTRATASTAAT